MTRIDRHPKYLSGKPDYDVAILVVFGIIAFTDTCQPIALPDAAVSLVVGVQCTVSGWLLSSLTGLLGFVLDLLTDVVTILTDSDCTHQYGNLYTARHCCARTCIASLGAPLIRDDGSKRWLAGFQSRSSNCGLIGILGLGLNAPSIFTDCTNPEILAFCAAPRV